MTLIIRSVAEADTEQMTALLNTIILAGGTTAHQRPFDAHRMLQHYAAPPGLISCMVAENKGSVVGFQCLIWPNDDEDPFPQGWAIIATFAKAGMTGSGIGSALFNETRAAAKRASVQVIDATIRADNYGGLRYYSKMGFEDYSILANVPLHDGTLIDRVRKRFDL